MQFVTLLAIFSMFPLKGSIKAQVSGDANLQLVSTSSDYELEEEFKGNLRFKKDIVSFRAIISNHSDSTIIIAHPGTCRSDSLKYPYTFQEDIEYRKGKSEIILYIRKQEGETIILREKTYPYFEGLGDSSLNNSPYLVIPPGKSQSFHVGWFFTNARGRWVEDDKAAKIFLKRGTFRVQLRYQNMFTDCQVPDKDKVWTGKLISNEVTIDIK